MNSPTSQILMPLAMVLVTIMTIVLFAVHHANRQIPGLQSWARSYLCGLLLAIALLARHHAPEWLLPVVTAVLTFLATWLNVAATRAYTGRSPWQPAYLALALAIMLGLSIHLSWWQPNPTLRLALVFGVNGTLMLLSARAISSRLLGQLDPVAPLGLGPVHRLVHPLQGSLLRFTPGDQRHAYADGQGDRTMRAGDRL